MAKSKKTVRRCSLCGLPGHDRRSHRKNPTTAATQKAGARQPRPKPKAATRRPAKATRPQSTPPKAFIRWMAAGKPHYGRKRGKRRTRRNVDGYLDEGGQFHPIRASKGYSDWYLTVVPAHLERAYNRDRDQWAEDWREESRHDWLAEVKAAVKAVSPQGIAPHRDKNLTWEYRHAIPIHLRNNRGLPADEVADLLRRDYPGLGIESEDDLLQALKN